MAGILPEGGTSGAQAINGIPDLTSGVDGNLKAGCAPLFYGNGCRVQFDPAAENAMISEFLNVLRDRGYQYDCAALDNLSKAVGPHMIAYECRINLPTDPWPVANGEHVITQGTFTIPNSSGQDIYALLIGQLTLLVKTLSGGDDENLDVNLTLSDDDSYDGRLLYCSIQMRRSGSVNYDSWQTVKTGTHLIPSGGRTFYFQLKAEASAANAFQLKEDQTGTRWRAYGVSATTVDRLQEVR